MKKRTIIIILLFFLLLSSITLYTTFAYNEEDTTLEKSDADYNFIYQLKEKSNKEIIINPNEEKYVDIVLTNTYSQTVKYGMYYYMIEPNTQVDGLIVSLSEDSPDLLENIIKPNQTRSISLKIVNNSDTQIDLLVGALVGFEKGEIKDLAQNGEILIK